MNFCSECGGKVTLQVPEGDDRPRFVCDFCAAVHYQNPKMVVGSIPVIDEGILLCRRAIEPRRGRWTIPAGWLENGETLASCAVREAEEEAWARIGDLRPYVLVDLPFINQVYFIFRARLLDRDFRAGPESLEVKLFRPEEIPWDDLAFSAVRVTLKFFCTDLRMRDFPFRIHEQREPLVPASPIRAGAGRGG